MIRAIVAREKPTIAFSVILKITNFKEYQKLQKIKISPLAEGEILVPEFLCRFFKSALDYP